MLSGYGTVVTTSNLQPDGRDGVSLEGDCATAERREWLSALSERARVAAADSERALVLAGELGGQVPLPGAGRTRERWSALATLGAADLTVARVVEPHLDAVAILGEAGHPDLGDPGTRTWGVYAAEGSGVRLDAAPSPVRGPTTPNSGC